MSQPTTSTTVIARSGKFFLTKIKRQALDFSSKWLASLAAGASALAVQTFVASYFDFEISVPVATLIASAVTLVAGQAAGYIKAEVVKTPPGQIEEPVYDVAPHELGLIDDDPVDIPGPDHRAE